MSSSALKHSIQSILKEVDKDRRTNHSSCSPFSREGFRPFRYQTFKYSTIVPFPIEQRVHRCGCVIRESVEKTTLTNVASACATEGNVTCHGFASPGLDETSYRWDCDGVSPGLDITPHKSAFETNCLGILPQQTGKSGSETVTLLQLKKPEIMSTSAIHLSNSVIDRFVKAQDTAIFQESNPCVNSKSTSNGLSSDHNTISSRDESISQRPNIALKRSASPPGTDNTSLEQSEDSKRQRRMRTTFTTEQLTGMEEVFAVTHYPNFEIRKQLSETTDLEEERIQIWFQNRRAKWRKYEKLGNFGGLEHLRETEIVPAPMSRRLAQMPVLPISSACQPYLILDQTLPPHFDAC